MKHSYGRGAEDDLRSLVWSWVGMFWGVFFSMFLAALLVAAIFGAAWVGERLWHFLGG